MIEKLISGGQSGADRAGLEVARALGIPTGGTAPKGYRTEYGSDLDLRDVFGLSESASADYSVRMLANVREADGTVIFGTLTGGAELTRNYCEVLGKPCAVNPSGVALLDFLTKLRVRIRVLNVAGNRHSKNPFVFDMAADVLVSALEFPGCGTLVITNPHQDR